MQKNISSKSPCKQGKRRFRPFKSMFEGIRKFCQNQKVKHWINMLNHDHPAYRIVASFELKTFSKSGKDISLSVGALEEVLRDKSEKEIIVELSCEALAFEAGRGNKQAFEILLKALDWDVHNLGQNIMSSLIKASDKGLEISSAWEKLKNFLKNDDPKIREKAMGVLGNVLENQKAMNMIVDAMEIAIEKEDCGLAWDAHGILTHRSYRLSFDSILDRMIKFENENETLSDETQIMREIVKHVLKEEAQGENTKALEGVIALGKHKKPGVRKEALDVIWSAMQSGVDIPFVEPVLIENLTLEQDEEIREAAARALGYVDTPSSVRELEKLTTRDGTRNIKITANSSLKHIERKRKRIQDAENTLKQGLASLITDSVLLYEDGTHSARQNENLIKWIEKTIRPVIDEIAKNDPIYAEGIADQLASIGVLTRSKKALKESVSSVSDQMKKGWRPNTIYDRLDNAAESIRSSLHSYYSDFYYDPIGTVANWLSRKKISRRGAVKRARRIMKKDWGFAPGHEIDT